MYCSVISIVMCLVFKLILRPCTFISVSCFFFSSSERRKFINHAGQTDAQHQKEKND